MASKLCIIQTPAEIPYAAKLIEQKVWRQISQLLCPKLTQKLVNLIPNFVSFQTKKISPQQLLVIVQHGPSQVHPQLAPCPKSLFLLFHKKSF